MQPVFEANFRIHSYEVDFRGRMRLFSLLNYLQEAAGAHAALLHLSVADLHRRGLTWVLSHYHVRVERYPRFGETIRIRTWPSFREGKGSLRDFRVTDEQDDPVALAASSWVLLDRQTKRPVSIADYLPPYPLHPERAITTDFPALDGLEEPDLEMLFRVRMADIDVNHHVNNAIYPAWALETVPEEILHHYLPVELEIQFRAEALYEDRVLSWSKKMAGEDLLGFLHRLVRESDGRELTRLRSRWQRL
jgi:medium-chain acyl-[acyl-carrier-protein] hydrolase